MKEGKIEKAWRTYRKHHRACEQLMDVEVFCQQLKEMDASFEGLTDEVPYYEEIYRQLGKRKGTGGDPFVQTLKVYIDWRKNLQARVPHVKVVAPAPMEEPHLVLSVEELSEGAVREVVLEKIERSAEARKKCIQKFGYVCRVCGFDFAHVYGELGKNYIEVHHKKRLADQKGSHSVEGENDLVPLCANCHAMVHRYVPPLGVEALKKILDEQKKLRKSGV